MKTIYNKIGNSKTPTLLIISALQNMTPQFRKLASLSKVLLKEHNKNIVEDSKFLQQRNL